MTNDQLKLAVRVLGLALVIESVSVVKAEGKIFTGQVRGESVERIDGADHRVERYVGRPGALTLEAQLENLKVVVASEDRVESFPHPALGLGSAIRITRANRVTVNDASEAMEYRTWAGTVGQLLDERQVQLGADDEINKVKNDTIVNGMKISITRVELTEIDEKESVAFKTESVDDPTMEKGESRVLEAGKRGVRTKTFRLRRENGKLVEKTLLKSELTIEPKTEKISRGTKTIVYGTGQATWYALKSGMGAAHNTLPNGTKVKVTNLANGKAVDVVINDHGIQGNAIIDLTADAFKQIAPLGAGRVTVRIEKDYD